MFMKLFCGFMTTNDEKAKEACPYNENLSVFMWNKLCSE